MSLQSGRDFVFAAEAVTPAIWGKGDDVLWAAGESMLMVGPQGVGKSTLMQQVSLARAGIIRLEVAGLIVTPDPDRVVLYIAADRPRQIQRSMRRMVKPVHADDLDRRLVVHAGPLPFDLVKNPKALLELAETVEAGTVVVDSLKDIAAPLSSEEVGAAVNRAFGLLVAAGVEVAAVHHQRKAQVENKKPRGLADVYGSTWITSGAGSVVCLWGEPGDPLVQLTHLKQPVEEVGPLELVHDHEHGRTDVRETPDVQQLVDQAAEDGVTSTEIAQTLFGSNPSRAQVMKAQRRLDRLVRDGQAIKATKQEKVGAAARYQAAVNGAVTGRDEGRDASRDRHAPSREPEGTRHAPVTRADSTALPIGEGAVRDAQLEPENAAA